MKKNPMDYLQDYIQYWNMGNYNNQLDSTWESVHTQVYELMVFVISPLVSAHPV